MQITFSVVELLIADPSLSRVHFRNSVDFSFVNFMQESTVVVAENQSSKAEKG
jgi:hypothetical protein